MNTFLLRLADQISVLTAGVCLSLFWCVNSYSATIFGVQNGGNTVYAIDLSTGIKTALTSGISSGNGLVYGDGVLYGTSYGGSDIYGIDVSTGEKELVGSPIGYSDAFTYGNGYLFGVQSGGNAVYSVNLLTGASSYVTSGISNQGGLAYQPGVVPIPTTAWLFGSALAGLLVAKSKNKN